MNNKIRPGSLILMILIVMAVLVVIVHSMLCASTYLILLSQERKIF